jgi:acetyl-CoA synthetase
MSQSKQLYEVPADWAQARIDARRHAIDYQRSVTDPELFWGHVGQRIDWIRPYTKVKSVSYGVADFHIRWFEDGTLNLAQNCLDRHLAERGDRVAIFWEGDSPGDSRRITYRELHAEVCRFGNVLRDLGARKGARVAIYLPMIPEVAVAMLACAGIGAVHCVIFAGFSAESIADRIRDCGSCIVITADDGLRGGKRIPLKQNVDTAIAMLLENELPVPNR